MQTVRTLRKTITRDEFKERMYLKSKSSGSMCVLDSAFIIFDNFCKMEYGQNPDELVNQLKENQGDELYHFLQDFINFMTKKDLSVSSVKAYFSYIRTFLRSQGIKIYSEDIRDLIRFPTQVKEMLEPLSKEQIKILLDYSKPNRKALYLTLLSSGMRIGEALALRKRDFDLSKVIVRIRIPGIITKTKQTRETFISSEAKNLVQNLLSDKNDDDLVFGRSDDTRLALNIEEKAFGNLRDRCGLTERYQENKRFKISIHSMRAFFHTQASLIHDEQYANAMDGHTGYLMQYYRLSFEKRAEMYSELEPYLLIYTDERIAQNQEELRGKVQDQARDIEKLKKMIEIMQITKPITKC